MNYEQTSKIFKALADPNRMQIMHILQEGEKCACHLLDVLKIGQSTLSHHMKILCESGLVSARKDGKWTHYTVSKAALKQAQMIISSLQGK